MYKPEIFSVNLLPSMDKDNVWTGGLYVTISTDKKNPLEKNSYNDLMEYTQIVASVVAYMEKYPSLRGKLMDFLDEIEEENMINDENNIVQVDFQNKKRVH
tara:strand:- start:285 stop:587 length:303 start_codon:yes stop_codon:yes gene_type:complete